jgi:hypothetical protein
VDLLARAFRFVVEAADAVELPVLEQTGRRTWS